MSLRVWLPLTKDTRNQGLDDVTVTNNGATFNSTGKLGGCYYFNRSTPNYLKIDNPITTATNGISMAFWVKIPSNASGNNQTVHIGTGSGWNNNRCTCFIYQSSSSLVFSCSDGGGSGSANSTQYGCKSSTLTLNEWTHIACTYSTGTMKIYLNGILDKEYTTSIVPSFTSTSYIGVGAAPNANEPATVYVNDFRIYDHALSPLEVKHISQGLVLHYPLSDKYLEDTTNLVTGISAGGQTSVNNNIVITSGADKDTYFTINLSEDIVIGTQYTFSCDAEIPSGTWCFPLGNQNNTTLDFVLHNGHNVYTFVANDTSWGTKRLFMDDNGGTTNSARSTGLQTKIYNFQLEKKDHETGFAGYGVSRTNTIVYDTSGYKNNGTKINTLIHSSDTPKYNISTHFGATNQKIHIDNLITTGFSNSYSFAWWGKRSSNTPMFWGFSNGNRLNGMYYGYLWNTGDGTSNPIYKPNTTTQITAPSLNTWHHYVMTGDGTTCKLYLDGELYGQAKTYKSITGTSIYINGWDSGTAYCHDNMDMSDFRIYATALSADDALDLYHTSAYIDDNNNLYVNELSEVTT